MPRSMVTPEAWLVAQVSLAVCCFLRIAGAALKRPTLGGRQTVTVTLQVPGWPPPAAVNR